MLYTENAIHAFVIAYLFNEHFYCSCLRCVLQNLCRPKSVPGSNGVVFVQFSDTSVKAIALIPFFSLIFPFDVCISPSRPSCMLFELEYYCVCYQPRNSVS